MHGHQTTIITRQFAMFAKIWHPLTLVLTLLLGADDAGELAALHVVGTGQRAAHGSHVEEAGAAVPPVSLRIHLRAHKLQNFLNKKESSQLRFPSARKCRQAWKPKSTYR